MHDINCLLFGEQKICKSFCEFLVIKEMDSKEDEELFLYYTRRFILDGISNFTLYLWDISQDQTSAYFNQTKNYFNLAKIYGQRKMGFYLGIILFTNVSETITLFRDLAYAYNVHSVLLIFNYNTGDEKGYYDEIVELLVWIKESKNDNSEEDFVNYNYNFLFFDRGRHDSTSIGEALVLTTMISKSPREFSRYPFEKLTTYFKYHNILSYLEKDLHNLLSEESKRQLKKLIEKENQKIT